MNARLLTVLLALLLGSSAASTAEHRFVVFSGGKHGNIDQAGKVVIPMTLEGTYVLRFSGDRAMFAEAVKPIPKHVPYVDGAGKVHIFIQEKWGFINLDGVVVVPAQFDNAMDFSEGIAAVGFDSDRTAYNQTDAIPERSWGFIDRDGRIVIPARYRAVGSFSEGLAAARDSDGKWGYVNMEGAFAIEPAFDAAREFHGGLAAVTLRGKVGFINQQGRLVVKPQFTVAGDFSDGLAPVRRGGRTVGGGFSGRAGGRWSLIGKDGRVRARLPPEVDYVHNVSDGLAVVEVGARCGYIDVSGAFKIQSDYARCDDFSEGLADVLLSGRWKYIDKNGALAIDLPNDLLQVGPFRNGLASVTFGRAGPAQRFGYIDRHGNEVWSPRPAL